MSIVNSIKQVDWNNSDNKKVAETLIADAAEYMKRVEAHIFQGNEIRADSFMDIAEKQDAIRRLDKIRTEAHNKMLVSIDAFVDVLSSESDFEKSDYALENRTQKADFVASIVFEMLGKTPMSTVEGSVRDELAEMIHKEEVNIEDICKKAFWYF